MGSKNPLLLPVWLIVVFLGFVALYLGKSLIITIIFTTILLFIFSGMYRFFYSYSKNQWFSGISTGAVFVLFFLLVAYIISAQIDSFSNDISKVSVGVDALLQKYNFIGNYIQDFNLMDIVSKIDFASIGTGALSVISGIVGALSTVGFLLIFLMLEKNTFAKKFQTILGNKREKKAGEIYTRIYADMNLFFLSKFSLAFFNAAVSCVIMFVFGLEYALMFALLVFLLDFIPAVGGLIALMLPFLYSFAVFDSVLLSFVLLGVLFIPQFISGNILEPKIMGKRLNLSGFIILVSLIFWSSLWGILGAFLAVPLMACMNIVFSQFPTTRWISVLLSQNGEVK